MSALNTPGQDDGLQAHQQAQDGQHLQVHQQGAPLPDGLQQAIHPADHAQVSPPVTESSRKAKAPSVRRACAACHAGKTRCSEVLPCQSCLKRGLGSTCAYPDPDSSDANAAQQQQQQQQQVPYTGLPYAAPPMHSLGHPNYYDYSTFPATAPASAPSTTPTSAAPAPSSSTFRPSKRPRPLTDEEAAAITRNFTRGAFFIGQSEPIRIDPRLPVRLTLAEGDQVHFLIGETAFQPMA